MQVGEENQKDGGKLRCEEERPHWVLDVNKLQQQKQTPERAQKVPRATPQEY